jgi:hypothetical protein
MPDRSFVSICARLSSKTGSVRSPNFCMLVTIRPQDYDAHLQLRPSIVLSKGDDHVYVPETPAQCSRPLSNWTRTTTKWSSRMTACVCFESIMDPAKDRSYTHTQMVGLFLTSQHLRFAFTNGRSTENHFKAGEVKWLPEGTHLPENLGDQPIELVLVELKT